MEKLFQTLTAHTQLPIMARNVHKCNFTSIRTVPYYIKYNFVGCQMDFR